MNKIQNTQSGNILFIILLATALFAALAYAVSDSFRGGTNTIGAEQARVDAGALLRNMRDIKSGYDFLWNQQGCSMDDIDFSDLSAGLNNAPPCQIFDPLDGGISYPNNLVQYQTTGGSDAFDFYCAGIGCTEPSAGYGVDGLATASYDHMVVLTGVIPQICVNVNKLIGYSSFNDDKIDTDASNTYIFGDVNNEFDGQTAGCRARAAGGPYDVFLVLQEL